MDGRLRPSQEIPQPEVTVIPDRAGTQQWQTFFALIAALMLLAWGAAALGAEAQTAGSAAAGQKIQQIAVEIQKVGQELAPLFNSTQDLFEPAKRQAAAPKAVPALKKMIRLLDELAAAQPAGAQKGQERTQLMALLAALGDRETAERLKSLGASAVAAEAATGRSAQVFAAWLLSDGNPAGQQKVLDDLAALAKKYPDEPAVAGAAIMLAGTTTPEAAETRQKITSLVSTMLKGNAATAATQQLAIINHKFEAQAKLRALEGKPLVLEGPTPAGGHLSTRELKGKVVLVYFWASWCAPCKEDLPRLRKLYADHRAQGLEIVGVSCDSSGEDLVKFLSQNRDVTWPQLFDASKPGWHALADQYHVNAIPSVFLIDRKGVVRSVEARGNYEKLVPEMVKEKQ